MTVFDMGCAETAQRANEAGSGGAAGAFSATRDSLLPRPWVRTGAGVTVAREMHTPLSRIAAPVLVHDLLVSATAPALSA
jgi:hypothetical protein